MTLQFLDDVRAFAFTARTHSQLGFKHDRPGRTAPEVRKSGLFWSSALFAVGSDGLDLGVRWVPGKESVLDLPLVLAQGDRAQTLATTLRAGLSLAIVELAIGSEPDSNWRTLSERRAEAEPELAAFEALLGGASIGLLFDVLEDSTLQERLCDEGDTRKEAYVELMERLDPEQGRARRYIHSLSGAGLTERPTGGTWDQVIATAELKRALKRDDRFDVATASWALFQGPVALDAAMPGRVKQPERMRWSFGRWTALHAARALNDRADALSEDMKSDPLWPAIVSLADKGEVCDGLAFVEAAAHLDDADQPERAIAALAVASFLSFNALGQALSPIADAAEFIAKGRGWPLLELLLADPA